MCFWLMVVLFAVSANAQRNPSADLEKFWVDYDVYQKGQKGMLTHLKMTVYNMKGITNAAVRIMFLDENDKALPDRNKNYYTSKGNVAVFRALRIDYNPGYYDDLQIFMPYEELDLSAFPGKYKLRMDVDLVYSDTGELIQHLTFHDFEYTEPGKSSVNKVWIDYNMTEKGRKGMRVHVAFKVYDLKGVDADLAIYVQYDDGTPVKGKSRTYQTKSGDLAAFVPIKPCCNPTVYDDLSVFIPYDEFILSPGKYDLKLDIDLNYPNGELIQHLEFYEFEFTRRY